MKTAKHTLIGIYLCLIGTTFFGGCISWFVDPPPPNTDWYEYYIDEYYCIESITVNSPVTNSDIVSIKPDSFITYSESENKTEFNQIRKYYRDTYYNRESVGNRNQTAYCNEFIRFDVISDTDFDEEHPAGTSLGNIAQIISASPYKYIQSGYTDEYDWDSSELYYNGPYEYFAYKYGYHPLRKMLSELTAEDMLLLYWMSIRFAKMPDNKGTHIITVIAEDKEKEMTCEFEWIFE